MLITAAHLKDFAIRAEDGELGTITGCYFDDQTWALRYLLIDTGHWLSGRTVLISPYSVVNVDCDTKRVDLSLTKEQVEKSPDIDTRKPVSRQHEADFLGYYGYPYYWNGPYLWGSGYFPGSFATPANYIAKVATTNSDGQPYDSHLRSTGDVTGYNVMSVDGEIGHVDGFVIDDRTWAIRYLAIATRNWWPGKKVLISPAWIERVSWLDNQVHIEVAREAIKSAPEYIESQGITREYEEQLHSHYGQPPYWQREARQTLTVKAENSSPAQADATSVHS